MSHRRTLAGIFTAALATAALVACGNTSSDAASPGVTVELRQPCDGFTVTVVSDTAPQRVKLVDEDKNRIRGLASAGDPFTFTYRYRPDPTLQVDAYRGQDHDWRLVLDGTLDQTFTVFTDCGTPEG